MHNRFENIDALRGIAALLVVWQHSSEMFIKQIGVAQHGIFLAEIAKELDFGRIGIICFFLISGFVIPSSLKTDDNSGLKKFAIRRFFRLYPAYWVSIVMVVLISSFYTSIPSSITILANSTMIQGVFQQPHLNGLYWTLQVELIFYLLCAILFFFNRLHNDKSIFVLIVIFFSIFVIMQCLPLITANPLKMHKEVQLLPYLLSIMFLGAFYRKIYDNLAQNKKNPITLKKYVFVATFMCLGLPLTLLTLSFLKIEIVADSFRFGAGHSLGFVLFFLGIIFIKKAPRFILFLGLISYSLYLFHPMVMRIMVQLTKNNSIFQGFHVSVYILATTLFSILLAYTIYTFVEKPALKLSHRITK
ncbi:MAG: acyltransferase family protein [Marinicellaceae bacterium]